jgi:hypothetical protein
MSDKPYYVSFWSSDMDEGNDDNITGVDCVDLDEAQRTLAAMKNEPWLREQWLFAYIEGPEGRIHIEKNPHFVPDTDLDNEFAIQQGMGHGVDAYNEAIGSEIDDDPDTYTGFRR